MLECSSIQNKLEKVVDIWIEFNELEFFHNEIVEVLRGLKLEIDKNNNKKILAEYPESDYLRADATTAAKMLYEMEDKELDQLLADLEFYKKYSIFYTSMRRWLRDSISKITTCGKPKKFFVSSDKEMNRMKTKQAQADSLLEEAKKHLNARNENNREIFATVLTREA